MKWLITGGCGFIGVNLVRALLEESGHLIRIVDDLSIGTTEDLAHVTDYRKISAASAGDIRAPVEVMVADVKNEGIAQKATKGVDVIVHLAANTGVAPSVADPRADYQTNVLGTLNYLEAARINRIPRFVFASSSAPVGEVQPPIHEELAPHPVSPYGASKLAGEGYCSAYWGSFGVESVALRFGNVYGPGSRHKDSVVAKFVKDALSGSGLEICGDGRQTRDFIYVDDLVRAVKLAASIPCLGGETFQIAANTETTVSELAEKVLIELAKNGVVSSIRQGESRAGDVKRNYSDIRKASKRLGWVPGYTLDQGIARTVSHFLEVASGGEL